ncbi:alpha/beta fold hydrolase [Filimonas effusa]|nr:alpha/beta fold hydrolase [Filimonas effusa]
MPDCKSQAFFSAAAKVHDTTAFKADSVIFTRDSLHFGATISWPANREACPGIVLVSGTGQQNRDGLMAGHPVFKELAAFLNGIGFAVLRMDDRGVGQTNGVYETATTADFAADALVAAAFLKHQKGITKVGLMGHSEGGAAVCIAAAQSKEPAFIVSLAGLAAPGLEALKAQNRAIVDGTAGISDSKRMRLNMLNDSVFTTIAQHVSDSDSGMIRAVRGTYERWKLKDNAMLKPDSNAFRERIYFPIDRFSIQAAGRWFRFHIAYHPAAYMPAIKVPVLAINGDKDIMVPASVHLPYFQKYTGKGILTTVVISQMNHLLQECVSCKPDEYAKPTQHLHPQLLAALGNWLLLQKR